MGAAHLSDQCFPCCHLLVQLHLVISPPITAVCTAQGQAASELYLPSLCSFMKRKLPLPCCLHLFPWLASLPLPCTDCAVTPLRCSVCFFSLAGFSVLKEFTQSYAVRDLLSKVMKFIPTWASADHALLLTKPTLSLCY